MDGPSLPQPLLKYAPLPVPDTSGKMHAQPIRTLPVMQGGTLDRLRLLAERAAIRYGWDPVGAVNFILANVTPVVSTLRARVDWHEDIPALTRITLTIDPTATPAEVVHAYRCVRKKIARVFPRAMDSKSQWLAVATLSPIGHRALEERMEIWNSNLFWPSGKPADDDDNPYRSWWYDDPQKFGRDRRRAIQRLLHPKYRHPDNDLVIGMEIDPEADLPDDDNNDNASDAEGAEGIEEGIAEEQDNS